MFSSFRRLGLAAALSASVAGTAPAALAQTAPEDFFAELQSRIGAAGYTLDAGSRTMDGGTLVLGDVNLAFATPEVNGTMRTAEWRISPISEDGYDIALTASSGTTMLLNFTDPEMASAGPITVVYDIPGNRLRVGGEPDDRMFSYTADGMRLSLPSLPAALTDGNNVSLTGVAGPFREEGQFKLGYFGGRYSYEGGLDEISIVLTASGADGSFTFNAHFGDMTLSADGPFLNFVDPLAIFAAFTETGASFGFGSSAMQLAITAPDGDLQAQIATGTGLFETGLGGGGLGYLVDSADMRVSVSGTVLPFPQAQARLDRARVHFAIPMVPTDEPTDLALEVRVENLVLSDDLWAMFDPGGAIARDPVTVILDAVGTGAALVDMTDPEAMAASNADMPFRLDDLQVRELAVRLAGAEITASGSAVIDNSGPQPIPVGGLDVALSGIVDAIGQLQAAGFIGPEDAAQAQGMLGAFAVPGSAPDSYTSRVEITADGQFLVNGIPMQ